VEIMYLITAVLYTCVKTLNSKKNGSFVSCGII